MRQIDDTDDLEGSMLDRGVEEGWITPAKRRGLEPVARGAAPRRTADVVDEDRGVTR